MRCSDTFVLSRRLGNYGEIIQWRHSRSIFIVAHGKQKGKNEVGSRGDNLHSFHRDSGKFHACESESITQIRFTLLWVESVPNGWVLEVLKIEITALGVAVVEWRERKNSKRMKKKKLSSFWCHSKVRQTTATMTVEKQLHEWHSVSQNEEISEWKCDVMSKQVDSFADETRLSSALQGDGGKANETRTIQLLSQFDSISMITSTESTLKMRYIKHNNKRRAKKKDEKWEKMKRLRWRRSVLELLEMIKWIGGPFSKIVERFGNYNCAN